MAKNVDQSEPKLKLESKMALPKVEEKVLDYWNQIKAFERSLTERPENKPYVFYDGPPFVTGSPHYGSILGSIAKDVVPRYWTMKGYRVERQWGWDCHGLPIEHMIEKQLGLKGGRRGIEAYGIAKFHQACRNAIQKHDETWEKIIRRIGRWVDFKNSYKTMDFSYMESVWWGFKQLYEKDLVYEGHKVILYCPRCGTPLSNFEIAMDNSYQTVTEPANTYKYKLKNQDLTFLLAWSTTPWNKLATPALAVNPDLTYVKVAQKNEFYILAETRLEMLTSDPYEIIDRFTGQELVNQEFELHYNFYPNIGGRQGVVIPGNFVTEDSGTGIVTLAVYGEDDFQVMQEYNIALIEHVDGAGRLKAEVTPWAGQKITDVNDQINQDLKERNLMYKEESHTHSVAVCYRCGTRLYYAPLPAWYINVAKLKSELIAQNENINWYPDHLKYGRFGKGLEAAPDWNISRSRYWATPMPVWRDESGQHTRVVGSMAELKEWAVEPESIKNLNDLHREYLDDIEVWVDQDRKIKGRRIPEVFDVWIDSGSMPFASRHYPFENKQKFLDSYPAQFISEYIAQTRAWFYTVHVLSVALFGKHAFENAHTTGVILAEDGSKMSKSKNNFPDPNLLLNQDGADALRLYLMSSAVTKAENLAFNASDVTIIRKRVLNIWWNVFWFYQTYAPADLKPATLQPEHIMDRWIVALLEQYKENITQAMDNYDLTSASRDLIDFIDKLSTWYLRQSRDRLRNNDLSGWQTFHYVLTQLSLLSAPITPFIAEAIFLSLNTDKSSVHLEFWPKEKSEFVDHELVAEMELVRTPVEQGHAQRKALSIKVRQPLNKASVFSTKPSPREEIIKIMADELNVKNIDWTTVKNNDAEKVELDVKITPELEKEGQAREIIRAVQSARKEAGVDVQQKIILTLPDWPTEFETEIKEKTKATTIKTGPNLFIEKADNHS
jgi:isoleucyl-tRNA synthetase